MYYSKYNIDFIDNERVVVVNTLSSSIVRFEKEKFNALKNGKVEGVFSDEEINSLVKMYILRNVSDETSDLVEKRKKRFDEQKTDRFTITILTTTDCNARCFYCYENGIKKQNMTLETAKSVYEFITNNRDGVPVHINWFGGEPLYNSEIIDYICLRLKKDSVDYTSSFTTNAYLISVYKDKIVDLWHLKNAQITIDGIGKQYNKIKNYIYNNDVDPFEHVVNNIKWLLSKRIRISLRINFNPRRIEDAIETIKYIHREIGNPPELSVYCAWISDETIPSPSDYEPHNHPLLKLYEVLIDCGYILELNQLGVRPKLLTCSVHWKNMAVINVDGSLHKCQHGIMGGQSDAFGNIVDGVTNKERVEFWSSLEYPFDECKECVCLPICQGGCKYKASVEKDGDVCIAIKYCLKELLNLFYKKIIKGG